MNELKATPGEWFTKREGWSTVYVEARIGGGLIQEVAACGPTEAGPEQQEANAALIAAALELYTALDEMATFIRDYKAAMKDELPYPVLDRAEAALKKARGE